ncbi:MAG TPA: hypothetical protein VM576_10790 [Xanthomonadaceae bacterium]|nr:hypothetical protein [Xanthomonadaceae bacterium]
MKLIIREFLGQLKESGELDRLLPDLLARMKLIPISRPQIGVRQNGVDVAAVGKDEDGVKTLYLFVLKVGDVGRRDWDSGVNAIRATLDQVKDSYLRSYVRPEHQDLPIKIIVCTTGDLKQDVLADFNGFTERNTEKNLTYAFWSGDTLAEFIDAHLLDEYAINPTERGNLRRAIALIGTSDYDLRHAYELFRDLLLASSPEAGSPASDSRERKRFVRQLKTAALALEVMFHWANQEGNLLNAFLAGERCCLWAWDGIRVRELMGYRPAVSAYIDLYNLHNRICHAYFVKLQPYCFVRDAISSYAGESSLVANKVFEQIGLLAEVGLLQLQRALGERDPAATNNTDVVANAVLALIKNNPSSGSPRFDGHAIEISLALLLLLSAGKEDAAKAWLSEIGQRLVYGFRRSKGFPIATDSLDDLVEFDTGQLAEAEVQKLRHLSTLVPTVLYWCAIFGHEELYHALQSVQPDVFEDVCLQLWYPDEETDAFIYREPAQRESGTTEAPIVFPATIQELVQANRDLLANGTVPDLSFASAVRHGLFGLPLMACRHFRTPFPPQFWLPFLLRGQDAGANAEQAPSEDTAEEPGSH